MIKLYKWFHPCYILVFIFQDLFMVPVKDMILISQTLLKDSKFSSTTILFSITMTDNLKQLWRSRSHYDNIMHRPVMQAWLCNIEVYIKGWKVNSSFRREDSLFCNVWENDILNLCNLSILKGDYNIDILLFSKKSSNGWELYSMELNRLVRFGWILIDSVLVGHFVSDIWHLDKCFTMDEFTFLPDD